MDDDTIAMQLNMYTKAACMFTSVRNADKTRSIIKDMISKFDPNANPRFGRGEVVYKRTLKFCNNMRYQFMNTIRELARTYIRDHEQ